MDNNINKYFDFVLFEIEADCIEEEIEEIKSIIAKSSGYYGRQRNNVLEKATPIINKLQRAAARSRAEANKRKENIENIPDAEVKEIVKLKYIEGRTLEEIAEILYIDRTTASRKVKRYCNRHLGKG